MRLSSYLPLATRQEAILVQRARGSARARGARHEAPNRSPHQEAFFPVPLGVERVGTLPCASVRLSVGEPELFTSPFPRGSSRHTMHRARSRRLARWRPVPRVVRRTPGGFQFCPLCRAATAEHTADLTRGAEGGVRRRSATWSGSPRTSEAADPEDVPARLHPYHARLRRRSSGTAGRWRSSWGMR